MTPRSAQSAPLPPTDADSTGSAFRIEDLIRRGAGIAYTREYNCDLRRLLPWPGVVDTARPMTEFGLIWVRVRPGERVDAHDHDEEETFVVVSGKARLIVEGEETELRPGDAAYIPRHWRHQLINESDADFVFLDIYWDMGGAGNPVASAFSQPPGGG